MAGPFEEMLRSAAGQSQPDERQAAAIKTLRKLLQQAVNGERKQTKRADEAEATITVLKKRAKNNIDRSFNRGIAAAAGGNNVQRIVRHPEYGTD